MVLKHDRRLTNLALVAITLTSVAILQSNSQARLPMTIEHAEGTYTLTVPDTNTTLSAYGEQLRIYDAHIAVMFEVTYADCDAPHALKGRRLLRKIPLL